jgi:aminopeptidase N
VLRVAVLYASGFCCVFAGAGVPAQQHAAVKSPAADSASTPTVQDRLIGGYGPYRANNDLLHYTLALRVDPVAKTIAGSNTIRFRMLTDGAKMQLELARALPVDSITMEGKPLSYHRVEGADRTFYVEFGTTLHAGDVRDVVVSYHGTPVTHGRFGCFSFDKDPAGNPWITTACEGEGPGNWWPQKEQWRDKPQEGVDLRIDVPRGLTDVSNGRLVGTHDLGDGYVRWEWRVRAPINDYDVALNIGRYVHFDAPKHGETTLDYWVLPADLAKARAKFAQVPTMLDAYEKYIGPYPFEEDGYKLVEVPYAGMEHQSAIAYGNHFTNGYYGTDWAGVGTSLLFDFILIHESAHEWFGNAITAADPCDMWIHEGFATYMESLYVEYRWGKTAALEYLGGLKHKVENKQTVMAPCGVDQEPPEDQYFKGALMLNTLRSVVDDDAKWTAMLRGLYAKYKYKTITTAQVTAYFNEASGKNLTAFFDEYLHQAEEPQLDLTVNMENRVVASAWAASEPGFAMPVKLSGVELHPVVGRATPNAPVAFTAEQMHALELHYYVAPVLQAAGSGQ